MFNFDNATNYLIGKPRPPYRPEATHSTGAGDSAPEPKYILPMPSEPIDTIAEQCKYCDASVEVTNFIVSGYVVEDRKDNINMSAFLHGDTMIFSANFLTLEASINFCPMCGKKLAPHIIGATNEHGDDSE